MLSYPGSMAMAQSMSVSDRRKMFELESEASATANASTGNSNAIHDSLRKTKPTLSKRVSSPNITVRATSKSESTASGKSESITTVKKSSIFNRKGSSSSSERKKLNRASSDADLLESKRTKYRNSKAMDQANPEHTKSNEASPTHSVRKESARKRREPPKPPSPTVSPKESPIKRKPHDNGHKVEGASPNAKPRGEKPARPPSPKNIVRDKDLDITLSDGGCVCSLYCSLWLATTTRRVCGNMW